MVVVRIAALAAICTLLPTLTATGDERLAIRVTPAIAPAPAFVVVRAVVAVDPDNRMLEVSAESGDFYASSQVPLDGERSPRTSEVRFAGLPSGVYRVSATLVGSQGPRAAASSSIIVARSPGER